MWKSGFWTTKIILKTPLLHKKFWQIRESLNLFLHKPNQSKNIEHHLSFYRGEQAHVFEILVVYESDKWH